MLILVMMVMMKLPMLSHLFREIDDIVFSNPALFIFDLKSLHNQVDNSLNN